MTASVRRRGSRSALVVLLVAVALLAVAASAFAPRWRARSTLWAQSGETPNAVTNFDRPTYSSPIALSADKNHVWVVNPDDDSVSVITGLNGVPSVATSIGVGDEPQGIALDTNNTDPSKYRVYVANPADNGISIIRVTASDANNVTAILEVPLLVTGAEPWNVVASPDGRRVFVANSGQDTISVLRTDTNPPSIVGNVLLDNTVCNVGDSNRHFQPRGMAVSLASDRLYVTRFLSFTRSGGVQADDTGKEGIVCQLSIPADLATLPSVVGPIALSARVTGFNIDSNGDAVPDPTSAYPNQLQSIVIRGNRAFLPNIASSPSRPLRFNVNTQAFVNSIGNAATGTPADAGALNLHLGARDPEPGKERLFFANPWAIAFSNESGAGNAYVVSSGSDLLIKLNVNASGVITFTNDISTTRYIDLNDPDNGATAGANAGKNPLGIVIRNIAPTNNRAYVMNYISRNVSVVNLQTDSVVSVIPLTALPPAGTQEEQLQVGKEIFFSSRGHFDRPGGTTVSTDARLSSEGWQNCASCHFAALTDGTVWAFGAGPRKSVPLNATWSPQNPFDQRILNYSAIFDEVQDFELNIRNVSGPGPLSAGPPPVLDPNHGLLFADNGDINSAPGAVNAFALPNAGRQQHTVTLPGSATAWPALDAMKEWVRFGIRTPNGALTTAEIITGNGNPAGGLTPSEVLQGRRLFFQAGCHSCHGGTKWSVSSKDFASPPAAGEAVIEADGNGATAPNPNAGQYLHRFLRDIGSFNLNVAGAVPLNQIPGQPLIGGQEKDATGRDALGIDYDGNGLGAGFNIPALLGIYAVQPYYHNGACETLECVLANPVHRTKGRPGGPDVLATGGAQDAVVAFLKTLDAESDFPLNLSISRHDIFLDPPVVLTNAPLVVGGNVSLFGTRADLNALAADVGLSAIPIRIIFAQPGQAPTQQDILLPLSKFTQDFGQATITHTVNIGANSGLGVVLIHVDPQDLLPDDRLSDDFASRRFLIRQPPPDTTPPVVTQARISDEEPPTDNDAIIQSPAIKIKIVANDPASPAPAPTSGVRDFCVVSYTYDYILRRWIPQTCVFAPLPDPVAPDTFVVDVSLQPIRGVAYAFVWVRDAAGNISRVPGFDVVTFITDDPINLSRNQVMILRLPLDAGQNLEITADLETAGFGDVDLSVFDDFTNPSAARIDLSANNGTVNETVTVSGPGRRQVEIRAVSNSLFTLEIVSTAVVASAAALPAEAQGVYAGSGISVAGPPARQTEIDDMQEMFLPFVER